MNFTGKNSGAHFLFVGHHYQSTGVNLLSERYFFSSKLRTDRLETAESFVFLPVSLPFLVGGAMELKFFKEKNVISFS